MLILNKIKKKLEQCNPSNSIVSDAIDFPLDKTVSQDVIGEGFDKIYQLQEVDPSKVRPMGASTSPSHTASNSLESVKKNQERPHSDQKEQVIQESLGKSPQESFQAQKEYTHGFEKIYHLEKVDPNKVRPLQKKPLQNKKEDILSDAACKESEEESLREEFDLGKEYRDWIQPIEYFEPIEVLNLSKQAKQGLLLNNKRLLGDLIDLHEQSISLNNMGQGHIDEVKQKLTSYLQGPLKKQSKHFRFKSVLLALVGDIHPVGMSCILQQYQLESNISLSPEERVACKHLKEKEKASLLHDCLEEMAKQRRRDLLKDIFTSLSTTFLKPWMFSRQGIASKEEVYDFLQKKSLDPQNALGLWNFLQDYYTQGLCLFDHFLIVLEKGRLYAAEEKGAQRFFRICQLAKSYFYERGLSYPLDELISFLERECALSWEGFPEGFVEKTLSMSGDFLIKREQVGHLYVRLA